MCRVSKSLGTTSSEADSQWQKLSRQWDSASASTKKALNVEYGQAQKSQSTLSSWLSEAETSLETLYKNAAVEAEKKWEALKKVSKQAADKTEL